MQINLYVTKLAINSLSHILVFISYADFSSNLLSKFHQSHMLLTKSLFLFEQWSTICLLLSIHLMLSFMLLQIVRFKDLANTWCCSRLWHFCGDLLCHLFFQQVWCMQPIKCLLNLYVLANDFNQTIVLAEMYFEAVSPKIIFTETEKFMRVQYKKRCKRGGYMLSSL